MSAPLTKRERKLKRKLKRVLSRQVTSAPMFRSGDTIVVPSTGQTLLVTAVKRSSGVKTNVVKK